MKTLRSSVLGLMAAVLSGLVVLSILSFGLAEGLLSIPQLPSPQPTLPNPNMTPILIIQVTTTALPTENFSTRPTLCPQPAGWQPYFVQPGDTLANLAHSFGISLELLMTKNCLISNQIVADTWIYLPVALTVTMTKLPNASSTSQPSQTYTAVVCQPPSGWIRYTVKPGDTLTRISALFRISLIDLMQANCLINDNIQAGSQLWVPNVATTTLTPSPSPTPKVIKTTRVPTLSPTFTPTQTLVPSSTFTTTPTNTETPTPTSTFTPTPSSTLTPTPETITPPTPPETDTPT